MNLRALPLVARGLSILAVFACAAPATAQVHYHDSGHPWKQRARSGPDAEVPGWYYNLGITGMRAELVADEPKSLVIQHVFANSPAAGIVRAGDRVIGAGGQPFKEAHQNGYGEEVFGATGPIGEFAAALEAAQAELDFAASLCAHPEGTLIAVERRIEEGGVRERFRTFRQREVVAGADKLHAISRAFTFHEVEGEEEAAPEERVDLVSLMGKEEGR